VHLDDFDFDLPAELIAQEPARERSASRLLVVARAGDAAPVDLRFTDLPSRLRAGDLVVVNRSRVIPARLSARRDDGLVVEIFFLRATGERGMLAWAKPMRKLAPGDVLRVSADAALVYEGRAGEREARLRVDDACTLSVHALLDAFGHVPLPPYIRRDDRADDRARYQTVFAREPGSVAAPTAGLHFDNTVLDNLAARGVQLETVLLHVGAGTFQPLEHDDVEANRLHEEAIEIPAATLAAVQAAKREGRRVIAVGTTATRVLESAAANGWLDGPAVDRAGVTDIFLYPGRPIRVIDALVTNFHLPRSSLFVLVCAFMGRERALAAYRHAVAGGYRFFSYGDAMLIE